jgi:putative hydrolase
VDELGPDGPEGGNPFGGIPFLGDLAKMLSSQASGGRDAARQFAVQVASGGTSEPNPDPLERLKLEELARVADLQVRALTGLDTSTTGRIVTVVPVTRAEWATRTLDGWRTLLERLSSALSTPVMPDADEAGTDPIAALLQSFSSAFAPLLFGMQAGGMVGHLATRSLGQYDLPVPRPASDELVVVSANIAEFGEAWDLPGDDLRLWVCLSELATHAVLGVPHVRRRLDQLLLDFVGAFRVDPTVVETRLQDVDPTDPMALQEALGDPATLLGAIRSPEQRELQPRLEALVAAIVGYVDWVMDTVGANLIGSYGRITEAARRHRVETGEGDRFVEHLLGLELGQAQYDRGAAFVEGIAERAGTEGLARLWADEADLPTPAELDAPGLWLARIDLPDLA